VQSDWKVNVYNKKKKKKEKKKKKKFPTLTEERESCPKGISFQRLWFNRIPSDTNFPVQPSILLFDPDQHPLKWSTHQRETYLYDSDAGGPGCSHHVFAMEAKTRSCSRQSLEAGGSEQGDYAPPPFTYLFIHST
jgi:hypothetical protein